MEQKQIKTKEQQKNVWDCLVYNLPRSLSTRPKSCGPEQQQRGLSFDIAGVHMHAPV